MDVLRSSAVIGAVTDFLVTGKVLTIRDGGAVYTAGRSIRANADHGWEVNTYRPGGINETDDSFHSAAQVARTLVRVMFDKRRVDDALHAAKCRE